jgi:hypothetical protein
MSAATASLIPLFSLLVAAEGTIVHQDEAWLLAWDQRLDRLAASAGTVGTSRTLQPVEAGWWGSAGVRSAASNFGRGSRMAGEGPVFPGAALWTQVELAGAGTWWFARGRVEAAAVGTARTPARDPRSIWTDDGENHDVWDKPLTLATGEIGVVGLGHVLTAGNRSFQWGPGIFGSVVFARHWQGFPHLALLPQAPLTLIALGDHPVEASYEFIYGVLDGARPRGPSSPEIAGARASLAWRFLELGAQIGLQHGGTGQRRQGLNSLLDSDTAAESDRAATNRLISVDVVLHGGNRIILSGEYGIDDWGNNKEAQDIGDTGEELNGFLTRNAASWVLTLDWLDITGDGDHRLAVEWFRSMGYFYDHNTYPWTYHGQPIGHDDGANMQRIHLLYANDGDDGSRTILVGSYREAGWFDAEYIGRKGISPVAYPPGGPRTARVSWTTTSLDITRVLPVRLPGIGPARMRWDAGISLERNYLFDAGRTVWTAHSGAGWDVEF